MKTTKAVLFICRKDDRSDYDTAASMAEAMRDAPSGNTYAHCELEDLIFAYDGQTLTVKDSVTGRDVADFDAIFLLGWFKTKMLEDAALSVARYAAARGIPTLNSEALYTRSRTKLSQYVIAALEGVRMTPFVFSMTGSLLAEAVKESSVTFPAILKSTMASRGHDNYLPKSHDEMVRLIEQNAEVPFVVQQFVPNEGDYRLLVMGGQVRVALHRRSQTDSHINNTSQGGLATNVDVSTLDKKMLADAVTMSHQVRREVTGVDMIVHKDSGEAFFLEANNMPQLSTGSMVPTKMQALDAYIADWLSQ